MFAGRLRRINSQNSISHRHLLRSVIASDRLQDMHPNVFLCVIGTSDSYLPHRIAADTGKIFREVKIPATINYGSGLYTLTPDLTGAGMSTSAQDLDQLVEAIAQELLRQLPVQSHLQRSRSPRLSPSTLARDARDPTFRKRFSAAGFEEYDKAAKLATKCFEKSAEYDSYVITYDCLQFHAQPPEACSS